MDPGADGGSETYDEQGTRCQGDRPTTGHLKERGGWKNAQATHQEWTRSPDLPEEQYDANLQGTRYWDKTLQSLLQEIQDARAF